MFLDYERFTFILLNSNEFPQNVEKLQIKKAEQTFEKVLSAESMRDLDKISDEDIETAMQNIEKMCGGPGSTEKKKSNFLQSIEKVPSGITERIL